MRQALLNTGTVAPVTVKTLPNQVLNNTGGYVYEVSDEQRLRRFLVLGTEGGSYYASEREVTFDNVTFVRDMIQRDEANVLRIILDVSSNTLAPKHSPTLFALASVFQYGKDWQGARSAFKSVVRTATHLFEFIEYAKKLGGFGPKKRKAVNSWFLDKSRDDLAYQAVKYRQRNGWTLGDVLRISRPNAIDPSVAAFILGKAKFSMEMPAIINGFHVMQNSASAADALITLDMYPNLPWETIPTQFLRDPIIWQRLFTNGQLRGVALIRNLKRLNEIGAFTNRQFLTSVAATLQDETAIVKSRLHPVNYFNAIYNNQDLPLQIQSALEAGFYLAFKNIVPSGKRILVAVDVSSSMTWSNIAGMNITANQGAGLMALTIIGSEPNADVVAYGSHILPLDIKANEPIKKVVRKLGDMNFGATNPALAIDWADKNGKVYDAIVSITDSEVNTGKHIDQRLEQYRRKYGVDTRIVTVGMTATRFTQANPLDNRSLDVVGFSSDTPKLISDFVAGRF